MSRTPLILTLLLGTGLSSAWSQEAREKKDEPRPAENRSAGAPAAPASAIPATAPSATPGSLPPPSPERSRTDGRVRSFAESLLKQYDDNKNGVLEKDEWLRMQDRWHGADRNADGTITLEEMIAHLSRFGGRGSGETSGSPGRSAPPPVRALPPVSQEKTSYPGGAMPQPVRSYPPTGTTITRPSPISAPDRPIDPRAPLVSVQLVMVEVSPEDAAAKAAERQPPTSSGPSRGTPRIGAVDLSAPNEKILDELRKAGVHGRLEVLYRMQLTTVDQQTASFQFGLTQPSIRGVTMSQFGQTNNVDFVNTGLRVEVQPRAAGETVAIWVNLNDSRLGRPEDGVPISIPAKGEVIRAPLIQQVTLQTTVNVPSGQTIVLGALAAEQGARKRQLVLLVCPRIVPLSPSETTRPAR